MTYAYLSIGPTLADQVNIETICKYPPHILPKGYIRAIGAKATRTMAHTMRYDGAIDAEWWWDELPRYWFNRLIWFVWGGFHVGSVTQYIIARNAEHRLAPFKVNLVLPNEEEDYDLIDNGDVQNLRVRIFDCRAQYVTKAADATLTASERLALFDTAAGDLVATLPPAADVAANTLMGIEKTAAAHTLTVQAGGSDTFTPVTESELHARITVASNGIDRWNRVWDYENAA